MRAPEIKVEKWFKGKSAAIAITLDDWTPGQAMLGADALMQMKLPATFYVTLHNMHMRPYYGHWEKLQLLKDLGYEIGNHTITHPDLTQIPMKQCIYEINEAKKILDSHLKGTPVETFAYPQGCFNDDVVEQVMHGHVAARAFSSGMPKGKGDWPEHLNYYADKFFYDFAKTEKDYFSISQFRVNDDVKPEHIKMLMQRVITKNGLVPMVFHGFYDEENTSDKEMYDAMHLQTFRALLAAIKSLDAQVWITTLADAVKYHRVAAASSTELNWHQDYEGGGARYEFWLRTVDSYKAIKLHPLTLSAEMTEGRRCTFVGQGSKELEFRMVGNSVQFDVEPLESIISIKLESI